MDFHRQCLRRRCRRTQRAADPHAVVLSVPGWSIAVPPAVIWSCDDGATTMNECDNDPDAIMLMLCFTRLMMTKCIMWNLINRPNEYRAGENCIVKLRTWKANNFTRSTKWAVSRNEDFGVENFENCVDVFGEYDLFFWLRNTHFVVPVIWQARHLKFTKNHWSYKRK